MINVVTVHHQSDLWIDVQLSYLARHIQQPYRVWACIEGVHGLDRSRFYRVFDEPTGNHFPKLNFLARRGMQRGER